VAVEGMAVEGMAVEGMAVEGMADAAIRAAFPCGKPGESSGMNGRE
jgi:hypothetical protein